MACVQQDGQRSERDLRAYRTTLARFQSCMCAYSGWEPKYLLQAVQRAVTCLNTMHADAGGKLISAELNESLCNLIHNGLRIGEYEGKEDTTVEWRKW